MLFSPIRPSRSLGDLHGVEIEDYQIADDIPTVASVNVGFVLVLDDRVAV